MKLFKFLLIFHLQLFLINGIYQTSFSYIKINLDGGIIKVLPTLENSYDLNVELNNDNIVIPLNYHEEKLNSMRKINDTSYFSEGMLMPFLLYDEGLQRAYIHFPLLFQKGKVGIVRFAHSFSNTKYSLIHQLFDENLINTLEFSIQGNNASYLYLGGKPEDNSKFLSTKVKVVPKAKEWIINMNGLKYKEHYLNIERKIIFSTDNVYIKADQIIFNWIRDIIFFEEFKKGICYEFDNYLRCRPQEITKEINHLQFIINNTEIPFTQNYCYEKVIMYQSDFDDSNIIKLPWDFFNGKRVTFNYQDDTITIFTLINYNPLIQKTLIYLNVLLSLILGGLSLPLFIFHLKDKCELIR